MPNFEDIYEFENRAADEDPMFNDDDRENQLISDAEYRDMEDTSIRELNFNQE